MSIVPLDRVTLIARREDGPMLLERLQALGVVHLDALDGGSDDPEIAIDARIRAAYRWLARTRIQRHRQRSSAGFEPQILVERAEVIREQTKALEDQRLALLKRIEDVRPWGNFAFRDIEAHPALRLWFYEVPWSQLGAFEQSPLVWAEIGRDARRRFLVVIDAAEPEGLPVPRIHLGSRPLDELETALNAIEVQLDDLQAERASLTRWLDQFRRTIDGLIDRSVHAEAVGKLAGNEPLLIAEGWAPCERCHDLRALAGAHGAALVLRPPLPEESPPTMLRNPPLTAPGEALVRFFTTPDYRSWDPTGLVLAGFILFFAIIVSDALYGVVLATLLLLFWRTLGRTPARRQVRTGCALAVTATVLWGVLVGSYAGSPPPLPLLERAHLIPAADTRLMLALSLGIGLAHLIAANVIAARRLWPHRAAWARIGWILLFGAAPLWFLDMPVSWAPLRWALAATGIALILGFSSPSQRLLPRLGGGALALTRLVGALGDTLSYLRLFALAVAGTSLAAAFNALAAQAWSVPGVGLLFGLLILAFGHGLNLALGVASGVVHGLRLNYIEFFGWGLWGEGRPFRAFDRREASS